MQRRKFIQLAAGVPFVGAFRGATANGITQTTGTLDSWKTQFEAALADNPWLLAFRSAEQTEFQAKAEINGQMPAELTGTLFRNGPAQHEIGPFRYHHWFDGDGMLQAYRLDGQGVRHQGRMIQTRKYLAERDAGRALYPGFASIPPDPKPVTGPDLVNTGNISVLPHHGKLLALWEAGSAWEMDPDTLETRGVYNFSTETEGLPFSAHPRVEADGTLWNFGYASAAGLLVMWHIAPNGKVQRVGTIKANPMSMPHDFVVTERHIVLMIPPLHYEPKTPGTFLDAHVWHPERATRVLVVNKNDFSDHRWLELPAQWVFHYGNAWEDKSGVIRFDGARAEDPMAMIDSFRNVMRGVTPSGSPSHHHAYRIDTQAGTISERPMFDPNQDTEFPTIDPRVSCRRNRRLVMLSSHTARPTSHGLLNSVSVYDEPSDRLTTFRYPDTVMPEEHLFVPKPGSEPETDGWVVGTALNYETAQTELNVFDVTAVDAGPVATARLPYALPFGLHGKFASS